MVLDVQPQLTRPAACGREGNGRIVRADRPVNRGVKVEIIGIAGVVEIVVVRPASAIIKSSQQIMVQRPGVETRTGVGVDAEIGAILLVRTIKGAADPAVGRDERADRGCRNILGVDAGDEQPIVPAVVEILIAQRLMDRDGLADLMVEHIAQIPVVIFLDGGVHGVVDGQADRQRSVGIG